MPAFPPTSDSTIGAILRIPKKPPVTNNQKHHWIEIEFPQCNGLRVLIEIPATDTDNFRNAVLPEVEEPREAFTSEGFSVASDMVDTFIRGILWGEGSKVSRGHILQQDNPSDYCNELKTQISEVGSLEELFALIYKDVEGVTPLLKKGDETN